VDGFFALTPFAMFPAMARLMALFVVASVLSSCTGAGVGDYVPNWAGGLPKNAPPRPGTPEYDAYIQNARSALAVGRHKSPDEACCDLTTLKKGIGQDREPAVSNRQDELV
jgi:hypothetical protein